MAVNSSKYWVDRYEGALNGIENAVVLFCLTQSQEYSFAEGLKNTRNRVKKEHITWIYQKAKNEVPLDEIFKLMKVA